MLFAVQTNSAPAPFVRRQRVKRDSERKAVHRQGLSSQNVNRQAVDKVHGSEINNERTGEYALLLGVVFVAAIATMAIIGPQIAHLMAVSTGS